MLRVGRRLAVRAEVIRILSTVELRSVAGGITARCVSKPCTTSGCPQTGAKACTASEVCSYEC